jgi:hypothetical protein
VEQAEELEAAEDRSRRSRRGAADRDSDLHGAEEHRLRLASLVDVDEAARRNRVEAGEDVRTPQVGEERSLDARRIDAELARDIAEDPLAIEGNAGAERPAQQGRAAEHFATDALGVEIADHVPVGAVVEELRETIFQPLMPRRDFDRRERSVDVVARGADARAKEIDERSRDALGERPRLVVHLGKNELRAASARVDQLSGKHCARASCRS